MESTLRLVPSSNAGTSHVSVKSTTNELGVHDALRYGHRSLATEINNVNPLQHRLEHWDETQDNLRLHLQRNLYGLHLPVRQLMERRIVATTPVLPSMPHSNLHLDILMGRDECMDMGDVHIDADLSKDANIHQEMEKKNRI